MVLESDSSSETYGRYFEIAQKVTEGHLSRDEICMLFWDGSKFEPFSFSLVSARNRSRVIILRWLTFFGSKILRWFKIRIIIASNSISLRISSHLRFLTRDRFFQAETNENLMVRILGHLKITCKFHHVTNLLRWLFELKVPPGFVSIDSYWDSCVDICRLSQ